MKYIFSLIILLSALGIAHGLLFLLDFKFPPAVLAMGVLLLALKLNIVSLKKCEVAGNLLLKYFPLFFIPAGVGIIQHLDLIKENLFLIIFSVLAATIATLFIVGKVASLLFAANDKEQS